eukprot:maker-scaffold83_size396513-snap-gene-0.16 protein:Tk00957 transcript:maker-scaffold83_size396513-snap-gene-0.16-mRNA-1 annotation:"cationic amino acid transporter"
MAAATKDDYDAIPLAEKADAEKSKTSEGEEDDDNVGLKPKMTLLNGCTVIVGSIIGSGIFVSPSGVLEGTGSVNLALLVWIISGVFSMIGAYCYAELGCMIRKTGADYAYIMVTFGPFLAFIRLWVECIIVRPCSQAIVALTFSIYATKPFFPECDPPDSSVRLLAAMSEPEVFPRSMSSDYRSLPQKEAEGSKTVEQMELEEEGVELKPTLGLVQGCTVIIGCIIGSGIFIAPGGVLLGTGSINMALVVWSVCGVFSMIGAYCYAELGCMIKKTGGDYTYILDTFGPFVGFIRLWSECLIVRPCTITIVALTFAKYMAKPFFPDCEPPDESVRMLAAGCICLLTFVNCWEVKWATFVQDIFTYAKLLALFIIILTGFYQLSQGLLTFVNCWEVKWATFVQDIFTYAKLLALFIIILTGFYQLSQGKTGNFTFENTEQDMTKIALSFYSGLFAYNGWNYLNFVIEELQDPVKNLPRAIAISCVLVTLVYVLTNIAFYTTLSVPEVLGSEAVAVTFAERMYGSWAFMIPIFVAMSTFGGVNGILLTSSRLFYAGACEGQMPEILSMIQVNKMTPAPAVLVVAFLSLIYLTSSNIFALINYTGFATWALLSLFYLCSSNIYALINYVGFATWVSIGLAVFCLPYLRWKHPEWERPIKVSLIFPFIYCLATVYITIVPMIASPVETGIGIAIILTGVPVYFIFIYWKNKPQIIQKMSDGFTKFIMKLIVVIPPQKRAPPAEAVKAEETDKLAADDGPNAAKA